MRRKELRGFLDCHLHDVADGFFVVENFQRLRVITSAAAILARHITARQEIHFQFDYTLTFARFTAAALRVKRESARRIAAHARDRQLRVKIPNLIEHFDVGARRGARRFTDRRLIDFVNGFNFFCATNKLEQIAVAHALLFFQLRPHGRPNYLVHQCRFAAARNSRYHRKSADWKTNIDIFQIVRTRTVHFDPAFDITQRPARSADRMAKWRVEATSGLGVWIPLDVAQRASRHHFAAVDSRARPKIDNVIGVPHCFFVVLDHDQRITFVSQSGECFEQSQIVAWMQTNSGFIQNVKHATQI